METPDEFESIETAQVLNDLNKSRVTHPDDRSENAGDFHDSKPGNGTAVHVARLGENSWSCVAL